MGFIGIKNFVTSSGPELVEGLYREGYSYIMKTYYVYILRCSDATYYTGITSNLTNRVIEHQSGKHKDSYTFSRRPLMLMFYAEFTNVELAITTEKHIKKWSRAKKEALINNQFEDLPNLAKKDFSKH